MKKKGVVRNQCAFVEAVGEVRGMSNCPRMDSWDARRGSSVLDYHAHRGEKAVVVDLLAKWRPTTGDNAEELMSWQRAVARAEDTTAAAQSPEPHVLTAMTDGPSAVAIPFHRQTSAATRVVTVGLQARRVLRWRATIGDCCENATGLP